MGDSRGFVRVAALESNPMRPLLALAIAAGAITAPAAATPPIEDVKDSATVVASPAAASARPVALALRLHYEMLCAQPGKGPAVVSFPRALRLPAAIPAAAVLVDGKAASSLKADGKVLTIGLAPMPGVICQSLVPGILKIVFTRSARIGNPSRAGVYAVRARVNEHVFLARLLI